MILINLLPHREAVRKLKKERFFVMLGASAVLGGVFAGVIYLYYQSEITDQQAKNTALKAEVAKFDTQIKDIASLQEEIAALKARQQAVENLQSDRNMPVNLLQELVKQLPDGVYISSLRSDNASIEIKGSAQSQDRISELLKNISTRSTWFARPELIEIVSANISLSAREQRRVSNFSMRMAVTAAPDPAKGASAAATTDPVKGASAAAITTEPVVQAGQKKQGG